MSVQKFRVPGIVNPMFEVGVVCVCVSVCEDLLRKIGDCIVAFCCGDTSDVNLALNHKLRT